MKFSRYNLIFKYKNDYLLVNTFSGSLYRIGQEIKEIIDSGNIYKLDQDIIDDYYKKGIVLDDTIDERRIIKYYQNKEKYCTKVLSLTLLLTMECNFGCVYCFEGSKTSHKLYLEDDVMNSISKFVNNMLDMDKSIDIVSITLFGGEPLLNLENVGDWLISLCQECEEKGKTFNLGIVTNGSLLSEEKLDILSQCNCSTVQITVDGTENIHNARRFYKEGMGSSFKDVINGIKLVHNRKDIPNPIIRVNLDKSNIQNIEELLEYLSAERLNDCTVDFGVVKAGNKENTDYSNNCFTEKDLGVIFERLWRKMLTLGFNLDIQPFRHNLSCGLYSDKAFTICPDGKVYKCWEYTEDDEFLVGHISENGSIENINYHFYDWMTREFDESKPCKQCVYLPVCGGGCAAVSYENNKTIHSNGCYKVKGIFETKVKLFYEKSKKVLQNDKNIIAT